MTTELTTEYKDWIKDIATRFKSAQIKASIKVNDEMLRFYFSLGQDIHSRQGENKYGSNFYETVSKDLKKELPDVECFSPRNLRYMEKFYTLFNEQIQILPQLVAKLFFVPWGHLRETEIWYARVPNLKSKNYAISQTMPDQLRIGRI